MRCRRTSLLVWVMGVCWLPLTSGAVEATVRLVEDATDEGLPAFRIKTATATWLLEKTGAGLSSMIDREGNDWLSFRPDAGSGAGGEYRGFPNAVHQQAGSYFHPKSNGTGLSAMVVEHVSAERVSISARSGNGLWGCRYDFFPTHCTFTMTRMPEGRRYWVLYEGTPGGSFEAEDWWMTSAIKERRPMTVKHEGDIPGPEWIAFGDRKQERALFLLNHEDDEHPDFFYEMEKKMTVFGFGRKGIEKFIAEAPRSFSIGFVESTDHSAIAEAVARLLPRGAAGGGTVEATLEQYQRHALTNAGDPKAGETLFRDERRLACVSCHRVNDIGRVVGPDLSRIGGKFDRPHLIESVLEPSRQIVEGYRYTVVETKDGDAFTGIVAERSEAEITLLDATGQRTVIGLSDVRKMRETGESMMPEGLAGGLSVEEFTDLIAYLEGLRPGGKITPGAGITGPIKVPAGFEVAAVATNLTGLTAMEVARDGRIFVCEQTGALRVIKEGNLMEAPFVTLPVEAYWERGLIGVTVHPEFPTVPYVYVCYVAKAPYPHHRVSRFTADGDVAAPGSEVVLLEGDDQRKLGGHVPAGHQGGALHFGPDGKLYIAIGEQTAKKPSQALDSFLGKILRINADGTIPEDNPFFREASGKYRAIWARGFRNPYTFAFRPGSGEMYINDIGGKYEEINLGVAGGNYGWPVIEHGPTAKPGFIAPVHHYPHASAVGGDFTSDASPWPPPYRNRYFFADYILGWIKMIDPANPDKAMDVASGLRRPTDLRFAPDGSLYVLLRNAWVMDNKFQPGTGSVLRIRPRPSSE